MVKTLLTITGTTALIGLVTLPVEARTGALPSGRQIALEREATDLVQRADEVGREIQYHVDRLNRLAEHPDVSPWSHFQHLERVKFLINSQLRPALTRLAQLDGSLPDWKQDSVRRLLGAAQQLTMDVNSAFFRTSNDWRIPAPLNSAYRQFIAEMAVHAADLVTTADFTYRFASLRLKAAESGLSLAN